MVGLTLIAPPIAEIALSFGPPEKFSLALLGLLMAVTLSGASITKGLVIMVLGLLLGAVGIDPISGKSRFDFGITELQSGFDFVTIAVGVFGLGEIFYNLEQAGSTEIVTTKVGQVFPSMADWVKSRMAILRGTLIGFFIGIIPGGMAVISSLLSYAVEKKVSKHPEEFGQGAIEGVAGPESANNAASTSAFVPLLTLGIPTNAAFAMFSPDAPWGQAGAVPDRQVPDVFWGVIACMYVGNIMLIVLNLPMVGVCVQLLKVPYGILAPVVILFTAIGSYSIANQAFDLYALIAFGVLGYVLRKLKIEAGPLPLAFILGPMIEASMRQSLLISGGSFSIFVTRPISLTIVALFAFFVIGQMVFAIRHARRRSIALGGVPIGPPASTPKGGKT